jgi:type III secretion protein T
MDKADLFFDAQDFLVALSYTQPRTLALFSALPIFNAQLVPGMIRMGIAAGVGVLVAPMIMPAVHEHLSAVQLLMMICKEAFVGFALGYALAIPFWAFEAVGFLIDNQRGASIAATLNPLTGNDSSPLGILFNQAFIVFFFVCGGFLLILDVLYGSFALWPVAQWTPKLRPDTVPLLLAQLDHLVRLTMLYAAPVVVAMFLAEIGLALVSRFVPQLQVFFLAMPIKSALAIIVLIVYAATLFDAGRDSIDDISGILPLLQRQWQ